MFLKYVTLLLVCQLLGEGLAMASGLPIPGPVIGMALLFAGLLIRGEMPDELKDTATGVLNHLSLLFVPAGVGVMAHLSLLKAEWDAVLVSLVGSTLLTIAVTALVMKGMQCIGKAPGECDDAVNAEDPK